jgi:ribosomal protein L7/L12
VHDPLEHLYGTRGGGSDAVPEQLPNGAVSALQRGSKIEAIKLLREAQGIGLKESKETIERHLASHPELQRRMDAANADARRGLLRWVVIGAIIAGLLWYFFRQ